MIKVGNICYKDYSCDVLLSKEIKEMLESVGIDPDLSKRFPNPEYFFESFLFQKSELKNYKNIEIIYSNIDPKIKKEFLLGGQVKMTDIATQPKIRWIVVKK